MVKKRKLCMLAKILRGNKNKMKCNKKDVTYKLKFLTFQSAVRDAYGSGKQHGHEWITRSDSGRVIR